MNWTTGEDRRLAALIARGRSIRGAARDLGISESAAIARRNRVAGVVFPSDVKRLVARRAQRAVDAHHLDQRNDLIRAMRSGGFLLREVADRFNLSISQVSRVCGR